MRAERSRRLRRLSLLLPLAAAAAAAAAGAEPACPDHSAERHAWFGDLHVHSVYSLDASTQQTRTRPADAYRFARGERIGLQPFDAAGHPLRHARLARPLDFAAVTDHAELLGEWSICNHPDLPGHDSLECRVYRRWPRAAFFWMNYTASRAERPAFCGEDGSACREAARGPWRDIQAAAHAAYEPCSFTSFVGYEWTGAAGAGNNLHRNVIFAGERVPELPASFVETPAPTLLWQSLREQCIEAGNGCDALVIPHNPNLGAGRMFRTEREDGSPIDREEASARAALEPLVEVMQHKGDSECMQGLQSEDELCGFEKLAQGSFTGRFAPFLAEPPVARQFVRNVLKEGLAVEARLGVNPFRYGLVASTDTHLGTPGLVAESADYPGHGGAGRPASAGPAPGLPDDLDFNPGGLAVLFAEENTRASLFAAMARREAYGTSGPRIAVRFFGGFGYPDDLCEQGSIARAGYAGGVPMGGVLPPTPPGAGAPVFAVSALRDPGTAADPGTPLERIQIVKGWREDGATHERVFDVAGGPGAASVDVATCETSGPGADSLCAVWRDPDFEAGEAAFYYARVVENPTCRWSQRVCLARGVRCDEREAVPEGLEDCCSPDHARSIQERAWTSPIWYRP
jgi:hypothetical protein